MTAKPATVITAPIKIGTTVVVVGVVVAMAKVAWKTATTRMLPWAAQIEPGQHEGCGEQAEVEAEEPDRRHRAVGRGDAEQR